MNRLSIENWVLNIIERVKSGQPHEDFMVELKAEWILAKKAARRLGGHANAALGENILWLIGVDETKGVVGVKDIELAEWYPQIQSQFDGIAPELLNNLNIPIEDKTVVALLFATDRAPFVVKNSNSGNIDREVPWRVGNRTISATRSNLIRLLSPLDLLPTVQVLDAELKYYGNPVDDDDRRPALIFDLKLYVLPKSERKLVIPFHQCQVSFRLAGRLAQTPFDGFFLTPARNQHNNKSISLSPFIQETPTELIISGSGMVHLYAFKRYIKKEETEKGQNILSEESQVIAKLLPVNAERPLLIDLLLNYSECEEGSQWRLDQPKFF